MGTIDYDTFEAGDVELASGERFRSLKVAFKTFGMLNSAKDNVILYPTSFSAQHLDTQWVVAPGSILDPDRYFIIIPNLFANGLSSSPSNTDDFRALTLHDAVAVQRRLLTECFGISRIALVYGWSMGAMQAYHWAACHADMVERAAVVCGAARCAPYNHVFLEGVKAALTGDPNYQNGRFLAKPVQGLKAMGRVYAGWALSHGFYRDEKWRGAGFSSLEDYLARNWDTAFAHRDANNVMAQIAMWQAGDISRCAAFGGDMTKALAAITADILLMPGSTDRYFDPRDNEAELPLLVNARSAVLSPIVSDYGHRAGNPITQPAERAFIAAEVAALLER